MFVWSCIILALSGPKVTTETRAMIRHTHPRNNTRLHNKHMKQLLPLWQRRLGFRQRWIFGLFVCLSVCLLATLLKMLWRIVIKFYGEVRVGKTNQWLDFGSDPDHHADCPIGNLAITLQLMSKFWWNFQDNSSWYMEQSIKNFGRSGSPCWLSKLGIREICG